MHQISRFIVLAVIVLAWYIISVTKAINHFYLPPLTQTVFEIFRFFVRENGLVHIAFTLYRTLMGFAIASLSGILIGIILGLNQKIYLSFEMLIDFL